MSLDIELPDLELNEAELQRPRSWRARLQNLAKQCFGSTERILLSLLVITACLSVTGWNVSRLEILEEVARLREEERSLDLELQSVQKKLQAIDVQELQEQIQNESDRVFQGFPELAAWAEGLARYASKRGVGFSFRAENVHLSPVPEVLEIPLSLRFVPPQDGEVELFNETMHIVQTVLRDHWHVDVIGTSARGSGEKLASLTLNAQVWVRDRFGFVDLEALSLSSSTLNETVEPLDDFEVNES